MQLSEKEKAFPTFFLAFSKSALNFEHFQKKDDPHSLFISEIMHSGKRGSIYLQKVPFQRQHGKRVQTLLRSERQHRYHI